MDISHFDFGTDGLLALSILIFLTSLNCEAGGRVDWTWHSAGNYFSDGQIAFVAVSWLKVHLSFSVQDLFAYLTISEQWLSKSIKRKIGVSTVIENSEIQSGAKDLNRLCLLLISGQELFSFKGLLMCRQWNIISAYWLFPSLNCTSSFTVTHLQKTPNKLEQGCSIAWSFCL